MPVVIDTEAAVLRGPNDIEVTSVDLAEPERGEVLVDVRATGVCHSDLHRYTGTMSVPTPAVLGHEGAGVVERVGEDVTSVAPGDRVVLFAWPYCGRCERCDAGRPYLCPRGGEVAFAGTMLDGTRRLADASGPINHFFAQSSFASKAVVAAQSAVPVPDGAPLAQLCLLACGATTGIGAVTNTAGVEAGDSVAVFGCGGVGASAVLGAQLAGASEVVAVDVVPSKLETAEALGATHSLNAAAADPVDGVRAHTDGGVDYAFEFAGDARAMEQAHAATADGGTAVISGATDPGAEVSLRANSFIETSRDLLANHQGSIQPHVHIPRYARLAAQGALDLGGLVSGRYRLSELPGVLKDMRTGDQVRNVVVFD